MQDYYDNEIVAAIGDNDHRALKRLFAEMAAQKIDINDCMFDRLNYLELAYNRKVSRRVYRMLLAQKIDPLERLCASQPVIYRLIWDRQTALFKYFLEQGANPNVRITDNTSLELSLEGCNHPTYSEFETPEFAREKPLLCGIIEFDNLNTGAARDMLAAILKTPGVDLLQQDENGDNAYAYAAAFGTEKLMKALAKRNKKITEDNNCNLINAAVNNERFDNIKHLIRNGADVNQISKVTGRDPLGILLGRYEDVIIDYEDDKTLRGKELAKKVRQDPLHKDLAKILRLLIQSGAKLNNTPATAFQWEELQAGGYTFLADEVARAKSTSRENH